VGGGTATSEGAERKRQVRLDQINVAVLAIASIGYLAEHAASRGTSRWSWMSAHVRSVPPYGRPTEQVR